VLNQRRLSSSEGQMKKVYNPKEYWSKHLEENFSLSGVGFTQCGKGYNIWKYRMRRKVLERVISKYRIDVPNVKILDIGCGSGFYVDIWQREGMKSLVGIDITAISARELSAKYPNFDFYEADITSPALINTFPSNQRKFDIITAFDVLFHIVDDNKFEQAIKNVSMLCSEDALIFMTDIFLHKRPYVIFHQKSRLLKDYVQVLSKNGIRIINRIPVHYLLNAPLDISNELLQKILLRLWWGSVVRMVERKTHLLEPCFFGADLALTRLFRESPSTEMIICRPVGKVKEL